MMTRRCTRFNRVGGFGFLVGELEHVRLPGGIGALMELDDLLRPMLLGTMKLRPLSVLSSETGVLGGNIEASVFRFWLT